MAVPTATKKRARKAALISLFTGGFGGLFYTGHWMLGLYFMAYTIVAFFMIFAGIGLFMFLFSWITGVLATYQIVRHDPLETAIQAFR